MKRWPVSTLLLLLAFSAVAAADDPPCRAYLVPCNLGASFSGTLHYVATVEWADGKKVDDVTARIGSGKAACRTPEGPIAGEGQVVVERGVGTDTDPAQPWYRIAVTCPGKDEIDTYKQPLQGGLQRLEGSVQGEHPETDPVNGVSGTVRLTWSLTRSPS
ncbi:MAG TPA: hypothetical protein VFV75_14515 [Candidatus Polarisedimenticolaceae bacterium]|nr:hypothetical protein [Candidatus Polarisedimenticolaceae bacterium]